MQIIYIMDIIKVD